MRKKSKDLTPTEAWSRVRVYRPEIFDLIMEHATEFNPPVMIHRYDLDDPDECRDAVIRFNHQRDYDPRGEEKVKYAREGGKVVVRVSAETEQGQIAYGRQARALISEYEATQTS